MDKRRNSLIILQMINFAGNSGYAIVIPLFPPLAASKGIDASTIGYIFCLYPVGGFIVSLILGQNMSNKRMKILMLIGLILTIIGMTGLGLVKYIDDQTTFIFLAGAMRLITGIGATFCFTPSYSLACSLFYDDINKVLAQMEIMSGIAMFSGPFVGSLFYTIGDKTIFGGYALPLYFLSLIYLSIIPFLMYGLNVEPGQYHVSVICQGPIDQARMSSYIKPQSQVEPTKKIQQSLLVATVSKLNYHKVFKIPGVVVAYITNVAAFTAALGVRTYLAVYLQDKYGLSDSNSTFIFMINTVVFGFTAFYVGHAKNINRKNIIASGLIFSSIAFFMYGPDTEITMLPHEIYIVCIAEVLYGLGIALVCTLMVPEFIENIKVVYPNNDIDVNDMGSALYISGWSIGEFAGPLIGGQLNQVLPFQRVGSIFGVVMFATFIMYASYVFLSRKKQIQVNIKELLI